MNNWTNKKSKTISVSLYLKLPREIQGRTSECVFFYADDVFVPSIVKTNRGPAIHADSTKQSAGF